MGKYIKSLFVAFIFIFLIDNVNAESIQNTCSSINQACSTKSRYTYSLYGQIDDFYTGSFGSRYSGKADYLFFDFDYSLLGNSTYILTISASDIDFRNISKSNTHMATSTSCADATGSTLEITNISYSYSKVAITFKTVSNTPRFVLMFGSDGGSKNVTGVNTFGFTSVDITTVESNDTQNIIDNANQNSQAIIDSSKENTEEIKDTIKDTMETCRKSYNLWSLGSDLTANKDKNVSFFLKAGTYTLSWDEMITNSTKDALFSFKDEDEATFYSIRLPLNNKHITFTLSEDMYFYRFYPSYDYSSSTGITTTLKNVMLVEGSTAKKYEEYGVEICTNKLDDVNDSINGLTGAITDSSPPDTSGLADAPGWLPAGPVDSIVTLPINLLQSLTNNLESACTPINLPIPFIDDNLTLDCPATLLKKIDGFWLFWEGFGLIAGVWILYKYFINLYKWVESHLSMDEKESLGKWGGV